MSFEQWNVQFPPELELETRGMMGRSLQLYLNPNVVSNLINSRVLFYWSVCVCDLVRILMEK